MAKETKEPKEQKELKPRKADMLAGIGSLADKLKKRRIKVEQGLDTGEGDNYQSGYTKEPW